jgi:DNA-binding GntR family transcriptional regulator
MDHLLRLVEEHGRILKALRKGRGEKARSLLVQHLSSVLGVLEDLKAKHAEYFE